MTITPGTVFEGKYNVIRQIGEGGMGSVFEVEHALLYRRFALKIMNPDLAKDSRAVARFFQEARAASAIGHPNIIEIFDVGQDDKGTSYFIMELLEGQSLEALLKRQGHLRPDRAAAIALQMLSALHFAHQKGIIHRDLKPANIFLAVDASGREQVKLFDFGIAKVKSAPGEDTKLTMPGAMLGTPRYAAPEQIKGSADVDHRIDIWAAGVLLYEMIAGERPFEGESYPEVLSKILVESHTPLRETLPGVSSQLSRIADKAMAKNPDERYRTAQEMIDDLAPFQSDALNIMSGTAAKVIRTSFPPPVCADAGEPATPEAGPRLERTAEVPRDEVPIESPEKPDPIAKTMHLGDTSDALPSAPEEISAPEGQSTLPKKISYRLIGGAIGGLALVAVALMAILWSGEDKGDADDSKGTDKITDKGSVREKRGAPRVNSNIRVSPRKEAVLKETPPAAESPPAAEAPPAAGAPPAAEAPPPPAATVSEDAEGDVAVVADTPVESADTAGEPPPETLDLNDIKQLLKAGKKDAALSGLRQLRRQELKNAQVVYLMGNLYFEKKRLYDAFEHYREAVRLDETYRKRPPLIRNLIEIMGTEKLGKTVMKFLRKAVGRPAVPYLRKAAKRHSHPLVKKRAAAILKNIAGR
jgi:serine/threonine protein kinase